MRDAKTDVVLHWGEVFFNLHKHCHLNKWEIWDYTLPQIEDLLKYADKYVKFEIDVMQMPIKALMGGGSSTGSEESSTGASSSDEDYQEATEEDINALARLLGGGY